MVWWGAGVKLGGAFVSMSDSLHGFEAVVGLDLRGRCSLLWFKTEEGSRVGIGAAFNRPLQHMLTERFLWGKNVLKEDL